MLGWIHENASIQFLNLTNFKMTDEDLKSLSSLKNLVNLTLDDNPLITSQGVKSLPLMDSLDMLWLARTGIDDEALEVMARMPKLTNVLLDQTRITDAGMKTLAKRMSLESVDVKKCRVTSLGVGYLQDLPKLRTLSVTGCDIDDTIVPVLRDGAFPELTTFQVSKEKLSKEGYREMEAVLHERAVQRRDKTIEEGRKAARERSQNNN